MSRASSKATKAAALHSADFRCEYINESGERYQSSSFCQVDHKMAKGIGGVATLNSLTMSSTAPLTAATFRVPDRRSVNPTPLGGTGTRRRISWVRGAAGLGTGE
jgi:hypothetical protein